MAPTRHARCGRRFRHRLADAPGLPFADQLTADEVERAHGGECLSFRDRLFTPLVTLWVFLAQVLDPDPSCRAAVARFLAWRAARGLAPCSANTGAYCRARSRLSESALARLARDAGRRTQERAASGWRWHGRTVKVIDGTTVSMPDTPKNQAAYPQSGTQAVGVGFPLARLVVLFSLAVGTALDAALGRYLGKQTGEQALFRTMQEGLEADDVLLADRGFSSYWEIAWARQRGADMVCRMHQSRHCDFRRGCRLGPEDHVVVWTRPLRPDWMDKATYAATPRTLTVREARVRVTQPGFRTRLLVVATTLLDAEEYSRGEVAVLYRLRWRVELDLRALKQTLQMDVLRGRTPEMVRKEVWAHLLAYNLLRGLIAEAAREAEVLPSDLSFKGAQQAVNAFAAVLWTATSGKLDELGRRLRVAVASHRVGDRPDRSEPRMRKRRPKPYPWLKESRSQARTRLTTNRCG